MIINTIDYVNQCPISGIKLQLLHVLKGTDLADLYSKKSYHVLSIDEYIDILISCIQRLSPDIVIHRLTGDGSKNILIAPLWSLDKRNVLNTLHKKMNEENAYQGQYY